MLKLVMPALICLVAAGCYSPNLGNGKLKCSVGDNKCPDGYHCAGDGTCWKNGQDPSGGGGGGTGGGLAAHKGSSVMTGGVTAKSEHYKVVMSTGQAPGGNNNGSSATVKTHAGAVGATQGK